MLITGRACRNLHYLLAIDTGRQAEDPIHEQGVLTNIILLHVLHIVTGEDRFALHLILRWTKIRNNSQWTQFFLPTRMDLWSYSAVRHESTIPPAACFSCLGKPQKFLLWKL